MMNSDVLAEIYEPFPTSPPLGSRFFLESVTGTRGAVTLVVRLEDGPRIQLNFDPAFAYRNTHESMRLLTWGAGHGNLIGLFTVKNSFFLHWAAMESCTVIEGFDPVHYCINTEDDSFDVLSSSPPTLTVL